MLTGSTDSPDGDFEGLTQGTEDIFIMKLDPQGNKMWVKAYGGADLENGTSISLTGDGGYAVTGLSYSNDGDFQGLNNGQYDTCVLKVDSQGNKEWVRLYGELIGMGLSAIVHLINWNS